MCGFIGYSGQKTDQVTKQIKSSLEMLDYRGPDNNDLIFVDDFIGAHCRLAILGLNQKANQPFKHKHLILLFNGEIYNYRELEKKYNIENQSGSDTEVLAKLIEIKGLTSLSECDGMFSGAIFDVQKKQVYVFRDPLGIKPVFYLELESGLAFASEIKALLPFLTTRPTVDHSTLIKYLRFENYPQSSSLFKEIIPVVPGEIVHVADGKVVQKSRIKEVWKSESEKVSDISIDNGLKVIEDSVKAHLISDVNVGVFLSGGIDSSLVATLASKHTSNILGFTGYFEDKNKFYDERYFTRLVAKNANIELREVQIRPKHFENSFDRVIWHLDEPRMGMGSFSQYIVAKEAAKERKVILAGHGGDELFAGYPMFKSCYLMQNIHSPSAVWSTLRNAKTKEYIWFAYSFINLIANSNFYFAPKIFNNKLLPGGDIDSSFKSERGSTFEGLFDYYHNVYIPGLLAVEDRMSMAHSLESRVPLWSRSVINFSKNIPIEVKLKSGILKSYLKDVASQVLPPEVVSAPKRGFPTPLRIWFRRELYGFVRERLLGANSDFYEVFDRRRVESLVRSHMRFPLSHSFDERRAHKLWMMLCIESWMRQFNVSL